jgi:hypothetical protein
MPSSPEATTRVNANRTVAREGRKSLSAPTSSNHGADRRRRRLQGIPPKHHAAVRVVDRLAAPKARSSTEPSALGRHPSIVDVP